MFVLYCVGSSRNSNSSNNKTSTEGRCCWRGGGGLARSRPGSGQTNIDILKNKNWDLIFTKTYWIFGNYIHPIQKNSTDSRCARLVWRIKILLDPKLLIRVRVPDPSHPGQRCLPPNHQDISLVLPPACAPCASHSARSRRWWMWKPLPWWSWKKTSRPGRCSRPPSSRSW